MSHSAATLEVPPSRSITCLASRFSIAVPILGRPNALRQGPPNTFSFSLRPMNWNRRITERRTAIGLSKAEFSRRVGVSGPTVTDWENGVIKTLAGENLLKAAAVLEVTPEWLLTGRIGKTIQAAPPIDLSPSDKQTLRNAQYLPPDALDALIEDARLQAEEKRALYAALIAQRHADETREPTPEAAPAAAHPSRVRKGKYKLPEPGIATPHAGHHKKRRA